MIISPILKKKKIPKSNHIFFEATYILFSALFLCFSLWQNAPEELHIFAVPGSFSSHLFFNPPSLAYAPLYEGKAASIDRQVP